MGMQDNVLPWLLRFAAFLYLFFAVAHGFAHFNPTDDARIPTLKAAADELKFEVMGKMCSQWDFYEGYSIYLSVDMVCSPIFFSVPTFDGSLT